ncbi:MAG: ABC transporter permease [Chitinophagaceae bacterium]|nr:ABC transporter permease [Chitinophagaceae bacterium]
MSKYLFASIILILLSLSSFSQVFDLEEKKPAVDNGIEYGYVIKNEQSKTASKEEFSRFEITIYATNKSGCTKLYADRSDLPTAENVNVLAVFSCKNANGKRLTAKGGNVVARDFYVTVKTNEKNAEGKTITRSASTKAGFIFRNGNTVKANIIVIVAKGESPAMTCAVNYLPELQKLF